MPPTPVIAMSLTTSGAPVIVSATLPAYPENVLMARSRDYKKQRDASDI